MVGVGGMEGQCTDLRTSKGDSWQDTVTGRMEKGVRSGGSHVRASGQLVIRNVG